jgi:hypothetical protein
MPVQGPRSPTSAANVSEAGQNGLPWQNPGNVYTSNNVYASITDNSFDNGVTSYALYVTQFGFAIPLNAVIEGILVEVERYRGAGGVQDTLVQLLRNSVKVGANRSGGAAWSGTENQVPFGGAADLWGTTWEASEINTSAFGVAIGCQSNANNSTAYIDHVQLTITYQESGKRKKATATARRIG